MSSRHRLFVAFLLLSAFTSSVAAGEPPGDLAAQFAALDAPQVSGEIRPAAPLTVGRAEIRPDPGAHLYVLAAAGRACGLLIDGNASLVYRVADRYSILLARRNSGKAAGLSLREGTDGVTLTMPLRGAAIWGWDLISAAATPIGGAPVSLPDWLRDIQARKIEANPARDMLLSDRNADPGFRWAVFHGAGDDLGLDVDPRGPVRTEVLYLYEKVAHTNGPYDGRLTVDWLVVQPIGRSWWEANSVEFVSTDTTVRVRNDTRAHAGISTQSRLAFLRDDMRLLPLELIKETASYDGKLHPLNVTRLQIDGVDVPFVHVWNSLLATLPRAYGRNDHPVVDVEADGEIIEYAYGSSYWLLGMSSWYPRPAPGLGLEWSEFRVSLTTLPGLVPFVAGDPSADAGTGHTVASTLKGPMDRVTAGAGKYERVTDERNGARVTVATYLGAKPGEARRLAGIVHGIRGCLEDLTGVPYPFRNLQLIEMNDWGWGQAPPGVIFITAEALLSQARGTGIDGDSFAAQATRSANERIAHEVAHGWFPHVAKIDRAEENWLSESIAEYMATVCLERSAADEGRGRWMFRRQVSRWKAMTDQVGEFGSIYLASFLGRDEKDQRERYNLLYGKGPMVLHAIRAELRRTGGSDKEGDRLFFTWIRSYVKNFLYKRGGTQYLIAVLNKVTSTEWQPWFERYVYGAETPASK